MTSATNVERITRRFYEQFKQERIAFLAHIYGIPSHTERDHYATLLLNRLMFTYFIQKKGFLDNDTDYLAHRLQSMQPTSGQDTFFRQFLLVLFHKGLGSPQRSNTLHALLGDVPYLGGDLFTVHKIESFVIHIPDLAFARLFTFFDAYQWHMDEGPISHDHEINPAILGYILEQYVNQQQMGAYYTKEDVTEYIAKNTIIPYLFDALAHISPASLSSGNSVWTLLSVDPDRYIHQYLRCTTCSPTETTRECTARRTRYTKIYTYLATGNVRSIDDLITYNLNICQFALDVINTTDDLTLLSAFYERLTHITILDPTCGSGAFLFAALTILEPLYSACLTRLQAVTHIPQAHNRYTVIKLIITNNLYGVDIMEEAIEICKLRLFLKLMAQTEHTTNIEPLPLIEHNIHTGNILCNATHNEDDTVCAWHGAFKDILEADGFDVIIGNPPYVEYNEQTFPYTLHNFSTLPCANLYPCVVERSHSLLSPLGHQGMILPLAAFATRNMLPLIEHFRQWFPCSWLSFYHFRPSMLFSGNKCASIPTAIYLAKTTAPERRFSTHLAKWASEHRDQLFPSLSYCPITVSTDPANRHYYPKFGHPLENAIMGKVLQHDTVNRYLTNKPNQNTMFYRSAGGLYWKVFTNFAWPYHTTSNKQCFFQEDYARDVFVALYNSSLFWWYYTTTFDTFNLKDYMLFGFRFSYPENVDTIHALQRHCQRLMDDFRTHAQHLKRGKTGSYTIYARQSKTIIDDIDCILAQHYGLTDEELDFIINYDIKYRMGWHNSKEAVNSAVIRT